MPDGISLCKHISDEDLPSLSIITVARNCEVILRECYHRIAYQDYPKEKIEMLLVDGGSTDGTKEVAAKFNAKVIQGGHPDNQEARRCIGWLNSKNELLAYIDSDNLIPEYDWLRKMVAPFLEDDEIIATQTLRYAYDRNETILNRYFALFGVNDPVAYYLRKMDRLSWAEEGWTLAGQVIAEHSGYYKVKFSTDDFPTLGCNGFIIRREALSKLSCEPEKFFHVDMTYDLAKIGLGTYGIVKTDIIHKTGDSFFGTLRKRLRYMKTHHQEFKKFRRYKVYDASSLKDNLRLLRFVIYAVTVIKPLGDATKGFLKKRDLAWFLHPLMCLSILGVYGVASLEEFLRFSRGVKQPGRSGGGTN